MNIILNHRGPDGKGVWSDDKIVLGHTRLSIIDLNGNCEENQWNMKIIIL